MTLFLLIRLLDLHSTYLNVTKWGTSVEGIKISRELMETFGYGWFAVINLTLSLVAFVLISKVKLGKPALKIFTLLNSLVVVSNYVLFLVV